MPATVADLGIYRSDLFQIAGSSGTFIDRLLMKIDATGDCWIWQGTLDQNGYGVLGRGARGAGNVAAHRAVWETLVGPIPEGMTYDHRCRVHDCVNPDHAEIVTLAENIRRGYGTSRFHAERDTCQSGHPKDGWIVRRTGPGYRYCKTCARSKSMTQYRSRGVQV